MLLVHTDVSAETGLITFTPKKKYQSKRHQEYVNIGDNQFIAIPKSSVTYDAATKEVTSVMIINTLTMVQSLMVRQHQN